MSQSIVTRQTGLLDLPVEIRLNIYANFFTTCQQNIQTEPSHNDTPSEPQSHSSSPSSLRFNFISPEAWSLLATCKAIYLEALAVYYQHCQFECDAWDLQRYCEIVAAATDNKDAADSQQFNTLFNTVTSNLNLSFSRCPPEEQGDEARTRMFFPGTLPRSSSSSSTSSSPEENEAQEQEQKQILFPHLSTITLAQAQITGPKLLAFDPSEVHNVLKYSLFNNHMRFGRPGDKVDNRKVSNVVLDCLTRWSSSSSSSEKDDAETEVLLSLQYSWTEMFGKRDRHDCNYLYDIRKDAFTCVSQTVTPTI